MSTSITPAFDGLTLVFQRHAYYDRLKGVVTPQGLEEFKVMVRKLIDRYNIIPDFALCSPEPRSQVSAAAGVEIFRTVKPELRDAIVSALLDDIYRRGEFIQVPATLSRKLQGQGLSGISDEFKTVILNSHEAPIIANLEMLLEPKAQSQLIMDMLQLRNGEAIIVRFPGLKSWSQIKPGSLSSYEIVHEM